MPGRPPKPTALKILEGNRGKRPLNKLEPQPTVGIPALPRWLRAFPIAVKEWRREAKQLQIMHVITHAEAGDLAMRAYIGAQIQELAAEIQKEGRVIEVKGFNKAFEEVVLDRKANPKCTHLSNLLREYRAIGSQLGLNPSSRARLKVEQEKPVDEFAGLIGVPRAQRQSAR